VGNDNVWWENLAHRKKKKKKKTLLHRGGYHQYKKAPKGDSVHAGNQKDHEKLPTEEGRRCYHGFSMEKTTVLTAWGLNGVLYR